MHDQIEIRDATVDDASSIREIQAQTWLLNYPNYKYDITPEDIQQKIDQWNKEGDQPIKDELSKPNNHAWAAILNGKTIGFIAVSKSKQLNYIEAIHILPEYQGQGIGSKLLTRAINWLKDELPIALDVVKYNQDAQRLYQKFGFRSMGYAPEKDIILPNKKRLIKILMVKNSSEAK